MKLRNIFYPVFAVMFSLCLFSCSDDDDDNGGNNDNTEVKNDYTATTSVKTATLRYGNDIKGEDYIVIYEDYNKRYSLLLLYGNICIQPYSRNSGYFNLQNDKNGNLSGIHDLGQINSLQDITEKEKTSDNWDNRYNGGYGYYHYSTVQPNHGYSAYFTTENDELKFVRIYIKDYTLDTSGTLTSITIQYQLY